MDSHAVLVEGFPGCGKSATAQWLARQLKAGGYRAEWFYESTKHPRLFLFVPKGVDPSLADFDIEAWHEQHGMDSADVVRSIQTIEMSVIRRP